MSIYAKMMRRFGECNHSGASVFQPGQFIDVGIYDGRLVVMVDCYSASNPERDPADFDVDQWEAEKLVLEQVPGSSMREAWRDAFRLARAFVKGSAIQVVDDATPFDMSTFLRERRKKLPATPVLAEWLNRTSDEVTKAFAVANALPPAELQEIRNEIGRLQETGASFAEAKTALDQLANHRRKAPAQEGES